jgi:cell shape-determining protein MreC
MLQGRGPGNPLALNFVQSGTAVRKREVIYTNESQGGVYPSNIPVARVTSYHRVSGATQITIRAAPIADLSNVAYVDVVRWEPSP